MIAALAFAARGGYYPRPHGAGGGGLLATLVHALVASLGWHAGASIAHLLGGWLIVLAVVAVVVYLVRSWLARPGRRERRRR